MFLESRFFSAYRFADGKQTIYLSPQADPGVVHTIMAPERAFETISFETARHVLGISHGWFKRFVKLGVIRKVPRPHRKVETGIFEKKSIDALASLLSSVVPAHEACKILGINQYQLAALKQAGVLQVAIGGRCNVLSGRYALEALNGLLSQLEQLATAQFEVTGNTTVLSAYYRSEINKQKFQDFIRAILEKRLKIYRLDYGTTTGLGKFAVVATSCTRPLRATLASNGRGRLAYALVRERFLETVVDGDRKRDRRVSPASMQAFRNRYVFLREVSGQAGCSPRAMLANLRAEGIVPVTGPRLGGCRQYLFERAHLESIRITGSDDAKGSTA